MKGKRTQPATRKPAERRVHSRLSVEHWSIGDLKPFERNPNEHGQVQIDGLAAAIQQFGFLVPVVVDKRGVIADGHGRVLAAKQLGLKRVPVVVAGHLSEQDRMAFTVAGNKLARMGKWNEGLLHELLAELHDGGWDLGKLSFSDDELKRLKDDVDRGRMAAAAAATSQVRAHERGGKNAGAEAEEPEEQVPFNVLLKPREREKVYEAIREVKARRGISNTADALLTIIEEWSHGPQDPKRKRSDR